MANFDAYLKILGPKTTASATGVILFASEEAKCL